MPDLSDFLGAFSLVNGLQIGSFLLVDVRGEHVTEQRNRKYNYPIMLTFQQRGPGDLNEFLRTLTQSLQGSKIVNSRYGNPYNCWIDTNDSQVIPTPNGVIVKVKGHSLRQY